MTTTLRRVWESADGILHRDKAAAKRHEAWLDLVALAKGVCDELPPSLGDRPEFLALAIVEHGAEVARLLRAKATVPDAVDDYHREYRAEVEATAKRLAGEK